MYVIMKRLWQNPDAAHHNSPKGVNLLLVSHYRLPVWFKNIINQFSYENMGMKVATIVRSEY
jgi:hypothetical protein